MGDGTGTNVRITNRSLKELPFDIEQEKEMKKLSDCPEDSLDGFRDYVIAVIKGAKKADALKDALPHRWERANKLYETGENGTFAKCITAEYNKVERIQVVKDMYVAQHKEWWKSFLLMKNQLFGNLYNIAMDELSDRDGKERRVIPRDRIAASKTLLEHMPELKEDTVIKIETKDVEQEFRDQLSNMQEQLLEQSRQKKKIEHVIEAEVEEVTVTHDELVGVKKEEETVSEAKPAQEELSQDSKDPYEF